MPDPTTQQPDSLRVDSIASGLRIRGGHSVYSVFGNSDLEK
jgi:hypothetical protein